ncbi:hypothetical protein GUY60_03390 [Streptomyces sp. YC537]|uniref:Uncharacterized protein n=1 Tax=Streptomyces boluensis TaxID=1775135 RepID=A0A964UK36_9ACTN|nr:hypothetical protein [Streptomyces boluensis]
MHRSDRAADRPAGFAEWLAKQECTDCWRASKVGDEQDKDGAALSGQVIAQQPGLGVRC